MEKIPGEALTLSDIMTLYPCLNTRKELGYTRRDFHDMELDILTTLDFQIRYITIPEWVSALMAAHKIGSDRIRRLAEFIGFLAYFHEEAIYIAPSDMGQGVLLLACLILGQEIQLCPGAMEAANRTLDKLNGWFIQEDFKIPEVLFVEENFTEIIFFCDFISSGYSHRHARPRSQARDKIPREEKSPSY
ncbi:hypothetical protein GLOTRDRAFT_128745 [Gloeophyllum trabeum ATCC 11539]|uniref:Cyclin N-terminal domain-containing protein n=1 Tax=Gloeophyllum trabeum (strain ATCC 11539 / FP-39264 / Madison 617) TaxID=670483 RepID=S7RRF7_GLOTA|nr:uncharacterized protein GLOTRDRAFT_128745 [Gloeophyllum trabeum ATCC 11539]EPQ55514.1 hypothetical protein GLOTRDRAFT_128745 [Gloeophyllum trabeum ATCC 11539]